MGCGPTTTVATMIKLLALLLLALPASAKPRKPLPGADELILKALAAPTTSYDAVERVQVFAAGKKPKALKSHLIAVPGGRTSRLTTAGRSKKSVQLFHAEDEAPQAGLDRLKSLYEMTVSTGGVVAKRKTWKIALVLRKSGVLRRVLWVDRDSGVLMKRETYRDDGSLARRERLASLTFPSSLGWSTSPSISPARPWAPPGFVNVGKGRWTNGLESYVLENGKVTGDLAEDDAARVLDSAR